MTNLSNIQFRERRVPASAETIARRSSAVERLDDMGLIDAADGEVNDTEAQWTARIGETEFAVLDFAVQKLDNGQISISLVALADAVSVGDPAAKAQAAVENEDRRAEADRHRMVVERLEFAQGAGDRLVGEVREQIQRSGGIVA